MSLEGVLDGWPVSKAAKSTLLERARIEGLMLVPSVPVEGMLFPGTQQRASELGRLSDL
jgi:hypothetical protein